MRRQPSSPTSNDEDLKKKVSWQAVRRLIGLATPYWRWLALSGGLALFSSAVQLGVPMLVRNAGNELAATRQLADLNRQVILVVTLILVGAGVGYVQFIVSALAGNRIVTELRLRLFAHIQSLPVAYFDRTRSGDLTSHLSNDVAQLQTTLTDDLVKFPGQLIVLVGGIGLALWMNWQLTAVVLILLMLVMAFFVVSGRALRQLNRAGLDALADAMGSITEAIANIRLVKAFAREPHENQRAGTKLGEVLRLSMRGARWEAMMASVGGTGFMLMLVGVVWYGGRGVLSGEIRLGDMLGFLFVLFVIIQPMSMLASLYTRLQRAVGAAERLFAILDEAPEPVDHPDAVALVAGPGEVSFQDVSFRYVPDVPVLQGLSLVAPAGRVTAVVGPSGAGKTTLASLVYRFYEPTSGRILIDGVPIDRIERRSLRENIGIVPQEPILFNGSLMDNIRYGRLDASDVEVEAAAREANVEEFVRNLPEGYQTVVGERGITLSGGQRQRVAIARALLKDPRILILDEATSALDTVSESLVKQALDRLMAGRTTIVIAHRLSTVQGADQIAVVAAGVVEETGTHAQLLANRGRYAELYEFIEA